MMHTNERSSTHPDRMDYFQEQRKVPLAIPPPEQINSPSIFSPIIRQCCQCDSISAIEDKDNCACSHTPCYLCREFDSRGVDVTDFRIPTHWLCENCDATCSVLEVMMATQVRCDCFTPTVRAIYDQRGAIQLWCRTLSESEKDLRQLPTIQSWREKLRLYGGEEWDGEVETIKTEIRRMETALKDSLLSQAQEADKVARQKMLFGKHNRAWSAISTTSMSSEDSLDRELVEMGSMEAI